MVSLAVAVSMTVRMALFWACQLPMSLLSLQTLRGLLVLGRSVHFGQIAALQWKVEHVTFISIFQGLMSKRGWLRHPWDWQSEYTLFKLKCGCVDYSLGSGASSWLLLPKKTWLCKPCHYYSAFLLHISSGERCSAVPCEIARAFCLNLSVYT